MYLQIDASDSLVARRRNYLRAGGFFFPCDATCGTCSMSVNAEAEVFLFATRWGGAN